MEIETEKFDFLGYPQQIEGIENSRQYICGNETQHPEHYHGAGELARMDVHFSNAVNMSRGTLTNRPVAEAHGLSIERV